MRKSMSIYRWFGLVAVLCLAPLASADTMTLTGVAGASLGGVYTGPYYATINGQTGIAVICDDFSTESFLGRTVNVTETRVSDLASPTPNTTVKFFQGDGAAQEQNYMAAAYLAVQLIGVDQSTSAGRTLGSLLNYAIWGLFDGTAYSSLSGSQQALAEGYAATALGAVSSLTVASFSNVSILTPNPASDSQEFLLVRTPESSAPVLLAFNMLALLGLTVVLRRRMVGFRE